MNIEIIDKSRIIDRACIELTLILKLLPNSNKKEISLKDAF